MEERVSPGRTRYRTDFCCALEGLFLEELAVEVLSFPRFAWTFERDGDGATERTDFCCTLEGPFLEELTAEVLSFPGLAWTFERDGDGSGRKLQSLTGLERLGWLHAI